MSFLAYIMLKENAERLRYYRIVRNISQGDCLNGYPRLEALQNFNGHLRIVRALRQTRFLKLEKNLAIRQIIILLILPNILE